MDGECVMSVEGRRRIITTIVSSLTHKSKRQVRNLIESWKYYKVTNRIISMILVIATLKSIIENFIIVVPFGIIIGLIIHKMLEKD